MQYELARGPETSKFVITTSIVVPHCPESSTERARNRVVPRDSSRRPVSTSTLQGVPRQPQLDSTEAFLWLLRLPRHHFNPTTVIQSLLMAPHRRPSPPLEPGHHTSTRPYPSFNTYDNFVPFILLLPIMPPHCTFHLYRMPAVCSDNPRVPLIESP
uniref:Uncharacterized protein n=1 Tax=Panagrellus redivivus TaxID=6233 RepID=A0A7E4ZV84_PANRE